MHLPEPAYIQFPSVTFQPPSKDLGCSALATTSRITPCLHPKLIFRIKNNGNTTEKIFENGRHWNSLYFHPSPPDGLEDFLRKSLPNRGSSKSTFCSILYCWLWPMLGYTPGFTTLDSPKSHSSLSGHWPWSWAPILNSEWGMRDHSVSPGSLRETNFIH